MPKVMKSKLRPFARFGRCKPAWCFSASGVLAAGVERLLRLLPRM